MTSVMDPRAGAPWSTMPGWGIFADLTPPELIEARALRTLRRLLALGLALVVVLCVGGYLLARQSNGGAHGDLNAANSRTTQLMTEQSGFAVVTEVKGATTTVQNQLATLFAADIDVATVMDQVRAVLPKGMSLTTVNIAPATGTPVAVGASAVTQVGTVTLGGTARNLDDLALYADALSTLRGFAQVVPSSNTKTQGSTTWTATAILTSDLLTHRFALPEGH